ncbi:hypothetical protein F5Y05DRAFT_398432, partial [Hypoxylon sp. FL0543]
MAESQSSTASTTSTTSVPQVIIKVYATADADSDGWTRPRRIHLHEKTSPNTTVCCASVIAGGIVEDQDGEVLYLTSDRLVPESAERRGRHAETEDGACACIGTVKHTSRSLHYALIRINESVADREAITHAKDMRVPVSGQLSFEAAMHPALIKYYHMKSDMVVLARTPSNEVFIGCIKTLSKKVLQPSFLGCDELMVAQFDPWGPRQLEVGTWVYAGRPGVVSNDLGLNTMLTELDHGPYRAEVFSCHSDEAELDPLVLVGHIAEVRERISSGDARIEATIQGAYEVLTAGIDPLYFEAPSETA